MINLKRKPGIVLTEIAAVVFLTKEFFLREKPVLNCMLNIQKTFRGKVEITIKTALLNRF